MKFIFKARSRSGELKEGTIEASSNEAAVEVLQKNELFPVSIREEKKNGSLAEFFSKYFDSVNSKELMVFFRQLAILIEAKVPIVSALSAIKEQTSNKYFQKVIEEMVNDIQDGASFSDALGKHRNIFSTLSINIIKAGEISGNLKSSTEYVADNIEKNYNLTSSVKSAMMYPAVVLVIFLIIAFVVMSFIVPRLTQMIQSISATVPWYTAFIINLSSFMANYWWAILVVVLGVVGWILYYIKTEEGKKEWDQIKIKLPIVGTIYQYVYITRFADNLAVLLAGGIPIIGALTLVGSVINNSVYEEIFVKAAEEVKIGGNMSSVLKKSSYIPPIVSQMVKIGEESGQIDLVLKHVARFYQQETDEMTKNLSVLLEPVLIVIIGAAVGFLAFSIIMPIYNIAGQL